LGSPLLFGLLPNGCLAAISSEQCVCKLSWQFGAIHSYVPEPDSLRRLWLTDWRESPWMGKSGMTS